MGNVSAISYHEMALCNIGFCYGQAGQIQESKKYYETALSKISKVVLATTALQFIRAAESSSDSEKMLTTMTVEDLLSDKSLKPKKKRNKSAIGYWNWWDFDRRTNISCWTAKDRQRVPASRQLNLLRQQIPAVANEQLLIYVTGTLSSKAPRIKWENCKVIGNKLYTCFQNNWKNCWATSVKRKTRRNCCALECCVRTWRDFKITEPW